MYRSNRTRICFFITLFPPIYRVIKNFALLTMLNCYLCTKCSVCCNIGTLNQQFLCLKAKTISAVRATLLVFFPSGDIWFHITLSCSWSYGLQCALHHLSTWFLKWNLSTTIVIVDILCAVGVNLLLTGLHPYFLRWHASSYIIVSENKNNKKSQIGRHHRKHILKWQLSQNPFHT